MPRPQPLTAVRAAFRHEVTFPDGRTTTAAPGDWVITRGKITLDVVGDAALRDRYQIVEPTALTIPPALCERLDTTLGIGATQSTDRLLAAVDRLARIEIGTIKIDFTPGQLEEIAVRAKKRGQSVQQSLQAVIDRIREELFWRS